MFDALDTLLEIADDALVTDEIAAECFKRVALQARCDRRHAVDDFLLELTRRRPGVALEAIM